MSASFTIYDGGDAYNCSYVHPVSSLIGTNVNISFSLMKDFLNLETSRLFEHSIYKPVPMKVFGKVFRPLNRNLGSWDIVIIPLAVYI